MPLFLLPHNAGLRPFFARIVQQLAEQVTTITPDRWDRIRHLHPGDTIHDLTTPKRPPRSGAKQGIILYSQTPHHVFNGFPVGELEVRIAQLAPPSPPISYSASQTSSAAESTDPKPTKLKLEIIYTSPSSMPMRRSRTPRTIRGGSRTLWRGRCGIPRRSHRSLVLLREGGTPRQPGSSKHYWLVSTL